ncbi:unnamed protein product [Phytomonas sp. Hart1]|nr:unnamed protein product [Phytomonas sp. Hart1]|eukprot:CCW69978.1 unnamed protein product [Phytomonas sp. isolate Hart1]
MPKVEYRTVNEKALEGQRALDLATGARPVNEEGKAAGPPDDGTPQPPKPLGPSTATSSGTPHHWPAAELLGAIGLPCPELPDAEKVRGLGVPPQPLEKEVSPSSSFSASSEGDDFEYEDLRQVQRRRRKEAAEERHRRKRRSPDRRQERVPNRRHHHQSRRADQYGDARKGRERRDRDRGGEKAAKGGRRYDLKRDHAKREDDRRRRH